jgi:quercetin dioxygenase-like cupin family protein
MRRVVTGNVDGRSRFVSDGPPPQHPLWEELWISGPDEPLGHDPEPVGELEPPVGAARWRLVSVPPNAVLRQMMIDAGVEDPKPAWHRTDTIDYVYVLDGEIGLEVDDGRVELKPGDCVVQRQTNHLWHNPSDRPVKLLLVMTAIPADGGLDAA